MDRTERLELRRPSSERPRSPSADGAVVDVTTPAPSVRARHRDIDAITDTGPGPLAVAWRDRWLLVTLALLTGVITYAVSSQSAPLFIASTTLAYPYSGSDAALSGGDAERSRSLRTEAQRITSYPLLEDAADEIGGVDVETLASQVEAIPASNADIVTVRATAGAPEPAAVIANEVAAAYRRQVDRRQQRSLEDLGQQRRRLQQRIAAQQKQLASQLRIAALRADNARVQASADPAVAASRLALEATVNQLSNVQVRLDQVTAQQASAIGRIQVLRPAEPPGEPEQPQPLRDAATMVVLALMVVVAIRWWLADPDAPLAHDAEIVESVLGVPVIVEVPHVADSSATAGIVKDDYPQVLDAYRMIGAMSPLRGSILVSAAGAHEACSDVVVNVAAVLGRDGYRIIAVEGDGQLGRLRRRRHPPLQGLTDIAAGRTTVASCMLASTEQDAAIGLVPWGTGQGLPRGRQSGLTSAIDDVGAVADVVLVDGPPLASSADALIIAANVDYLLLVVTIGTPVADLSRLRARLGHLDRPVLGVVVRQAGRKSRRRSRRSSTRPVRWSSVAYEEPPR